MILQLLIVALSVLLSLWESAHQEGDEKCLQLAVKDRWI